MRTHRLLVAVAILAAALVPLTAHAQAVPVLTDSLLDFGGVPFTAQIVKSFGITNAGSSTLFVMSVVAEDNYKFKVSAPTPFNVEPGDTGFVDVTYKPLQIGSDSTTIDIIMWSGEFDTMYVDVRGQGIPATPHIEVSTDSVGAVLGQTGTAEAVVEISNAGGGTIDWNAARIGDSWFGFNPGSGGVVFGAPDLLHVTFDPGMSPIGPYDGIIRITSTDPTKPTIDIKVHMDVVSTPIISASPKPLSFGVVFVGYSYERVLHVNNVGGMPLDVTDVFVTPGAYMVSETAFSVAPGGSHDITVTLQPTAPGSVNGTLVLYSNDVVNPQYPVGLIADGTAANPPIIQVDTDSIETSLNWGQTEQHKIAVGNTGEYTLTWQAQEASEWLSVAPESGAAATGETDSITVTFDAASLGTGDYNADVVVTSNDPATPVVTIPTLLHVAGYSIIELSDTVFFYDTRIVGQTQKKTVAISNLAIDPLVFDSVYVTDPNFTIGPAPTTIAYGDSYALDVSFAPQSEGLFTGALVLVSNAANKPTAVVVLQGDGVTVFDMTIPDSVLVTAGPTAWNTRTVSITNNSSQEQPVVLDAFSAGAASALYEDFEDLALDGWTVVATTATKEIVPGGNHSSLYAYRESNAAAGAGNGIFRTLPAVQPYEVSFWVRPEQDDLFSSYVALRDSQNRDVIFFLALDDGHFYVNANTGGHQSYPYSANVWYFIELRNIDWGTKTFDYYVDGELVKAGISLRNSTLVDDVGRVDLYCYSAGAAASWDNLWIAWGAHPSWLSVSPDLFMLTPGATQDVQLRIRSASLPPGAYGANVTVRTNSIAPVLPTFAVTVVVDSTLTGVEDSGVPGATALYPNHPNPFNPQTTIRYDLHEAAHATLAVYAVNGTRVRTLVSRDLPAGSYEVPWDGTDARGARVASGVYFYRLEAGAFRRTRKMVLLK